MHECVHLAGDPNSLSTHFMVVLRWCQTATVLLLHLI